MKQTTKRFISMILSLVFLVAAFIVYINFTVGAYDRIQDIKSDVLGRQNLVENQRAAVNQVQKLIETRRGEEQLSGVVSLTLPTEQDMGGAVAQLYGLSAVNKISAQVFQSSVGGVKNLAPASGNKNEPTSLVKPIGSMVFQVKLVGAYEDFKNFLRKLETNIRLFDVQNLNIQAAGKMDQDLYVYDLIVAAYYQNQ